MQLANDIPRSQRRDQPEVQNHLKSASFRFLPLSKFFELCKYFHAEKQVGQMSQSLRKEKFENAEKRQNKIILRQTLWLGCALGQ